MDPPYRLISSVGEPYSACGSTSPSAAMRSRAWAMRWSISVRLSNGSLTKTRGLTASNADSAASCSAARIRATASASLLATEPS
jgi:hypothetical protein